MTSRRTLLAMAAGLAAPAFAAGANAQSAAAPISKSQVGYQDIPLKGQVCAQCVYFIFVPASSSAPASRCKLVAGPISPSGWCEVWAPRA